MNRYLLLLIILSTSSCATRRYIRRQIAINNAVQTIRALDRESSILYATDDYFHTSVEKSEVGEKAHEQTVYEMSIRLDKRDNTTKQIKELGQ